MVHNAAKPQKEAKMAEVNAVNETQTRNMFGTKVERLKELQDSTSTVRHVKFYSHLKGLRIATEATVENGKATIDFLWNKSKTFLIVNDEDRQAIEARLTSELLAEVASLDD